MVISQTACAHFPHEQVYRGKEGYSKQAKIDVELRRWEFHFVNKIVSFTAIMLRFLPALTFVNTLKRLMPEVYATAPCQNNF